TRQRASPPHERPTTKASTSPTRMSATRPAPSPWAARSATWASSAPNSSEPTRPPPGVMASASERSRALKPWASTTQATPTRVPGRRQAGTLRAMPYTGRLPGPGLGRCAARAGEELVEAIEGGRLERYFDRAQRLLELLHRAGPDDRRGDGLLVQEPGEG